MPSLLPVILNTEKKKKDIFQIVQLSLRAQSSVQPSSYNLYAYTCTICTPMFSYTDRFSDLSSSLVQSCHYCCVSALHFSEITCQSKHMSSMYSWSLTIYVGFISRHIEPLMLDISEPLFSYTEPYTRCFLLWIKLPWDQSSAVICNSKMITMIYW